MKRRIFATLLLTFVLAAIALVSAMATDFSGGSGTAEDPYLIANKKDLDNVRTDLAAHYKMTADIVFTEEDFASGGDFYNGGSFWSPIGTKNAPFTGTFDGNGHSITGLRIDIPEGKDHSVGLFGRADEGSVIRGLRLLNCDILVFTTAGSGVGTGSDVGGIAGRALGIIEDCGVTGNIQEICTYSSATIDSVGGIVGFSGSESVIRRCFNGASVSADSRQNQGSQYVGGIVGYQNGGSVEDCYNYGSLTSETRYNSPRAGGIAGLSNGIVTRCYNVGALSAECPSSPAYIGGIVAEAKSSANVSVSYFLRASNCTIGVKYKNSGATVASTVVMVNDLSGMRTKSTYEGFDFTNVWEFADRDYRYPELRSIPNPFTKSVTEVTFTLRDRDYFVGDTLTHEDINLWAYYDNATQTSPAFGSYPLTYDFSTPGEKTVTITYEGATVSATVTVKEFPFASGSGTEDDPYIIETKYHLDNVRNALRAYYRMEADIVFTAEDFAPGGDFYNGGAGWEPIGAAGAYTTFSGVFDGNGHTITGLYQNLVAAENCYGGLFGHTDNATIKNLGVVDADISASITSGGTCAGGIVGYIFYGSISNCYFTGSVAADWDAGGIVGQARMSFISNCYNAGTVSTDYDLTANDPGVGHTDGVAGGIVGQAVQSTEITNCYNVGKVDDKTLLDNVGGIAGSTDYSTLTNCYYLDSCIPADREDATATKCTAAQMKSQSAFSGFDFTSVWTMAGNADYPYPELTAVPMSFTKAVTSLKLTVETTVFDLGSAITADDLAVEALYNTGETLSVPLADCTLTYNFSTEGTKTVSVTYGGKTATYTVTVEDMVFAGGSGTENDPYLIKTKSQLNNIRTDLDAYYKLIADITFTEDDFAEGGAFYNDGAGWEPIGKNNAPFLGFVDGDGHSITGLQLTISDTSTQCVGLFGYLNNATVRKLNVSANVDVAYNLSSSASAKVQYVGVLAGYIMNADVSKCTVTGNLTVDAKDSASLTVYAGGVAGSVDDASSNSAVLNSCISYVTVAASVRSQGTATCYAGGIAGQCTGAGAIVSCANTNSVSASTQADSYDNAYAGGIAGQLMATSRINNCYNTGNVTASSQVNNETAYAGGIVGTVSGSQISDSFNVGNISATAYNTCVGGIAGSVEGTSSSVERCYHAGTLSGGYSGAIVGYCNYSNNRFYTNYYLQGSATKGYGYTTVTNAEETAVKRSYEQMKSASSFTALGIGGGNWTMEGNTDYLYPELKDFPVIFTKELRSLYLYISKTSYSLGDTISADDLSVGAIYSGGTEEFVSDYTLSYDFSTLGEKTVSVTYGGKTATYTVTVENLADFAGGMGTEAKPYIIKTKAQLDNVRKDLDAHYKLSANITFTEDDFAEGGAFYNDGAGWESIGDGMYPFTGTFNGNGYTITGLYQNVTTWTNYYGGLFGCLHNATVTYLGVMDTNISVINMEGYAYAGGIAGYAVDSTLTYNRHSGDVYAGNYAGGIVGYANGKHSSGNSISLCYNTGSVRSRYYAGGIAGFCADDAFVSTCYNAGPITSTTYAAGGLMGFGNNFNAAAGSYNVGRVTAPTYAGGIVGFSNGMSINNCYYLQNISTAVGNGTVTDGMCTAAEMKQQSTFSGFDFSLFWTMAGNADYPYPELKSLPMVWDTTTATFMGSLTLNAKNPSAAPATVTITNKDDPSITASVTAVANGSSETFTFEDVALGDYVLTVEKAGFAPISADITVSSSTVDLPAFSLSLYGDVNGDGEVSAYDASLILQSTVERVTLTDAQKLLADVDGKDGVTAFDASLILRYTVESILSFPAESK